MAVRIGYFGKSAGVGQAGEKWQWKVFVDEDEEKLNEIEEVEYAYPTWPPQKRVIKDRESAFTLEDWSWGPHQEILVTARYADGREESSRHHLDFRKRTETG